jgi:hypothetical protein
VDRKVLYLILAIILTAFVAFSLVLLCTPTQTEENKPQSSPEILSHFPIPEFNATVEFAGSVSYFNASFEDNTWHFTDLVLNGFTNSTLDNFSITAHDCSVTIDSFLVRLYMHVGVGFDSVLNYTVAGAGNQTFSFKTGDYSPSNTWHAVTIDGVARENGDGWTFLEGEQSLTVANAASSVSIHSTFPINGGPAPGPYFMEIATLTIILVPLIIVLVVLTVILWRRTSTRA